MILSLIGIFKAFHKKCLSFKHENMNNSDYPFPVELFFKTIARKFWSEKEINKFTYLTKVQIFWEGHKNLFYLQLFIWYYLVASNYKWKIGQIFVAFSEYLNFNQPCQYFMSNFLASLYIYSTKNHQRLQRTVHSVQCQIRKERKKTVEKKTKTQHWSAVDQKMLRV